MKKRYAKHHSRDEAEDQLNALVSQLEKLRDRSTEQRSNRNQYAVNY